MNNKEVLGYQAHNIYITPNRSAKTDWHSPRDIVGVYDSLRRPDRVNADKFTTYTIFQAGNARYITANVHSYIGRLLRRGCRRFPSNLWIFMER